MTEADFYAFNKAAATVPHSDSMKLHEVMTVKRSYGNQIAYLSENRRYRANKTVGYDFGGHHLIAWLIITPFSEDTPLHDWRDMQAIKNQLCGEEAYGVEIYPAESDMVDANNNFHLWVYLDGYKPPFGMRGRVVVNPMLNGSNVVLASPQRMFDEPPKDAVSSVDAGQAILGGNVPVMPLHEGQRLANVKKKIKRNRR